MFDQLTRFLHLRRLARETRALRVDLQALTAGVVRIAAALEHRNAQDYPTLRPSTDLPDAETEVTFVNEAEQAVLMDIELRLTQASGQPPTEDEILQEYTRRHPAEPLP